LSRFAGLSRSSIMSCNASILALSKGNAPASQDFSYLEAQGIAR
jgi:hypothetical protein